MTQAKPERLRADCPMGVEDRLDLRDIFSEHKIEVGHAVNFIVLHSNQIAKVSAREGDSALQIEHNRTFAAKWHLHLPDRAGWDRRIELSRSVEGTSGLSRKAAPERPVKDLV